MPKKITESLEAGLTGFYIGNRLILPFKCQLLKIIVGSDIFTEMVGSKHIKLQQDPKNTSIYFRDIGKLSNMGEYQVIKLIACEWEDNLVDIDNHIKIICEIDEHHIVKIHVPSDDMLFIE